MKVCKVCKQEFEPYLHKQRCRECYGTAAALQEYCASCEGTGIENWKEEDFCRACVWVKSIENE